MRPHGNELRLRLTNLEFSPKTDPCKRPQTGLRENCDVHLSTFIVKDMEI